jgi:hypothetical protein
MDFVYLKCLKIPYWNKKIMKLFLLFFLNSLWISKLSQKKKKEKLSIVLGQILPNRRSFKQTTGARPQHRRRFCTKAPARVKIRNKSPNQILPATNTLLRAPSMFLVFTN